MRTPELVLALLAPVMIAAAPQRIQVISMPRQVELGSGARATLRINTYEVPSVRASVGEIEPPRPVASGIYEATYVPPRESHPQVAIITATTPSGFGWLALPLAGTGELEVKTTPRGEANVLIGERWFGPVRADAKGRAVIPIVVPPGTTYAMFGSRRLKLPAPEVPRPFAILEPSSVPANARAEVAVRVLVITAAGSPRRDAPLRVEATYGTLSAPREVEPGVFEATWDVPPTSPGTATLSAWLAGETGAASQATLLRPSTGAPAATAQAPTAAPTPSAKVTPPRTATPAPTPTPTPTRAPAPAPMPRPAPPVASAPAPREPVASAPPAPAPRQQPVPPAPATRQQPAVQQPPSPSPTAKAPAPAAQAPPPAAPVSPPVARATVPPTRPPTRVPSRPDLDRTGFGEPARELAIDVRTGAAWDREGLRALTAGAQIAWFPYPLRGYVGFALDGSGLAVREEERVLISGRNLELSTVSRVFPIQGMALLRVPLLGGALTVGAGGGSAYGVVRSAARTQPTNEESGWAPSFAAVLGYGHRAGAGSLFAEVRGQYVDTIAEQRVPGTLELLSVSLGYRLEL